MSFVLFFSRTMENRNTFRGEVNVGENRSGNVSVEGVEMMAYGGASVLSFTGTGICGAVAVKAIAAGLSWIAFWALLMTLGCCGLGICAIWKMYQLYKEHQHDA